MTDLVALQLPTAGAIRALRDHGHSWTGIGLITKCPVGVLMSIAEGPKWSKLVTHIAEDGLTYLVRYA